MSGALLSAGSGSPAVVLEAPDGSAEHWREVWPQVAAFARVSRHERAPGGQPFGAFGDSAEELRADLQAAGVSGPYLLVGHSRSASIVRAYASRYRREVAGLVLIDPMHEDLTYRIAELLTAEQADLYSSRGPPANVLAAWREEARGFAPLGDLPLVVLTAGRRPDFPSDWPTDELWRIWQDELIPELCQLSTRSEHLVAENAGHMIPIDQPEAVVGAIRLAVNAARRRALASSQ